MRPNIGLQPAAPWEHEAAAAEAATLKKATARSWTQERQKSATLWRLLVAFGLVLGAVLGIAGTVAPSASLRGLAWGLDGTSLIVGSALLAVYPSRRGNKVAAAGFSCLSPRGR